MAYFKLTLVALLVVGAGALAYQQHSVANKWQHDDQQEVQRNAALTSSLDTSIAQVNTLNKQKSSLELQLSAVSVQQAHAQSQTAVLTSIAQNAGTATYELNLCVVDLNTVANDLAQIAGGVYPATSSSDATAAQQQCAQAQADSQNLNQALRQVLSSG